MSEYLEIPGSNPPEPAGAASAVEPAPEPAPVDPPKVEEPPKVDDPAPEPPVEEPHKLSGSARLKKQRDEAREEAQRLAAELERAKQPIHVDDADEPKLYDFDDIDKWQDALRSYHQKRAETQTQAQVQATIQKREREEAARKVEEADAKFAADKPDWDDAIEDLREAVGVVYQKAPQTFQALDSALSASENAPALKYHLGKHPEELLRICALPPYQAIKELTRIEDKLTASPAPKPKTTQAPPPIVPLAGVNPSVPAKHRRDSYVEIK